MTLGELQLIRAAAVAFVLIIAAALVPWRLHNVAASRDDVRTPDPVESAAVNAIVAGMPDPAMLLDRAGRVLHLERGRNPARTGAAQERAGAIRAAFAGNHHCIA